MDIQKTVFRGLFLISFVESILFIRNNSPRPIKRGIDFIGGIFLFLVASLIVSIYSYILFSIGVISIGGGYDDETPKYHTKEWYYEHNFGKEAAQAKYPEVYGDFTSASVFIFFVKFVGPIVTFITFIRGYNKGKQLAKTINQY